MHALTTRRILRSCAAIGVFIVAPDLSNIAGDNYDNAWRDAEDDILRRYRSACHYISKKNTFVTRGRRRQPLE